MEYRKLWDLDRRALADYLGLDHFESFGTSAQTRMPQLPHPRSWRRVHVLYETL
jgi:hypothetical protein